MLDKAIFSVIKTAKSSSVTIEPTTKTDVQRKQIDTFAQTAKSEVAKNKKVTLILLVH